MDLFTAIDTRCSAVTLQEPAPTREHIQRIIDAGGHAPDHGKLAPWRFVVIEGEARSILGQALVASLLAKDPAATIDQQKRERDKVLRAPCIITVAARIYKTNKVPDIEQVLAVGAAVQNMFLAAHALGYGAMWKTGTGAYDVSVKTALGLHVDDQIVAFLYLGKVGAAGTPRPAMLENRVNWLAEKA
ncbi:MAG TPA: nitroreductase [Steroidobacteraceae bacterium]|nr:nitroreductase [Steroidobacteraceae bacterium]